MTKPAIMTIPPDMPDNATPTPLQTALAALGDLPIASALPVLLAMLDERRSAVLQAPPGAGKTTGVPLALLDQPWLAGRRVLMLEPRRLAARAAARRMADLLGEAVGKTAGYRVRLETRIGPATRIEVVTDGIFTRMIQDDPSLEAFGAVLFDEFHERRLQTDLGLALALECQAALRPDLRLVVMSATLDAAPIAHLMGEAPVVTATGRAFPVEIRHLDEPPPHRLAGGAADAVEQALDQTPGGLLVFLPGAGEIRRVERELTQRRLGGLVDILPLYGDLAMQAQQRALGPAAPGRRKIVLSTSIAETSLTIDGVTGVIDAGLARSSRYDPRTGMTRLETTKVSQAGADQRAGRAGRVAPGICWRLWPAAQHRALAARPQPEIATADLTDLALELAAWGTDDPASLRLLDLPAAPAYAAARRLLADLGALDQAGRITDHGQRMARLGVSPRLAHMMLVARPAGLGPLGCAIAALLTEGGADGGDRDADLRTRLTRLGTTLGASMGREIDPTANQPREAARRFARILGVAETAIDPNRAGEVLALAFPDRVAQRRSERGRFLLASGQGAFLPEGDPLSGEPMLAIAELDGQAPDARIWLAAPLDLEGIAASLGTRIVDEDSIEWDAATGAVAARRRKRLGALILADAPLDNPPADRVVAALLNGVRRSGLQALPWTPATEALRARVAFLARLDGEDAGWPMLDDASLLATLNDWLAPLITGMRTLAALQRLDMARLMNDLLDWTQRRDLDLRAPTHITVPSGSTKPIDYAAGDVPVLAVRLQELFGLTETPAVDRGQVPLLLHLLSPANRPIQVTADLPGFWAGSYHAVRADLRGRYPRHPWPENPLAAAPTARAKPRKE